MQKVGDDVDNTTLGYSFLTDGRNKDWVCISQYTNLLGKKKAQKWVEPNSRNGICAAHKDAFASDINAFRSLLLPLIHTTYGLPGRGTEVTNLILANTPECCRNIVIHRGCICIHSVYHKGMIHSNKTKDISRYLPNDVGELLVYYIWLVLPFWQLLMGSYVGATKVSPFLFSKDVVLRPVSNDKVWDTKKFSMCLEKFFGIDGLTVLPYRHIAIAIGRKKLLLKITTNDKEDGDNMEEEIDYRIDLQATHSTRTATRVYANVIDEEDESFFNISKKWHQFVLHRKQSCTHHSGVENNATARDMEVSNAADRYRFR